MTSFFGWLDYSEKEKRKMLDVISLFEQRDTRDELGIASIRDSFADQFFPGTSTIQTRARYFLFIPWMYQSLQEKGITSADIAYRARKEEVRLIHELLKVDNSDGVIGRLSRERLQRLPSNIYWQGLRQLRILQFPGAQEDFHRKFDWVRTELRQKTKHDDECGDGEIRSLWHSGLRPRPPRFPENADFSLSRDEALYLKERFIASVPESLIAFLLKHGKPAESCAFVWEHPDFGVLTPEQREKVEHARLFSECMYGAVLLYSLMLAELTRNADWMKTQGSGFALWTKAMEGRSVAFAKWNRQRFWEIARSGNPRIPGLTQSFVEDWLRFMADAFASGGLESLAKDRTVRQHIRRREEFLKRDLARLRNRRTLELWGGDLPRQLDFRWRIAERILSDIYAGLGRGN